VLLLSRIAHPFGLSAASMASPLRIAGAAGTLLVLTAAALVLLWQAFK
jgi:uncharacterized membrane protein YecN with MAPEG domain